MFKGKQASNAQESIETIIAQERLRQAKSSFNLALCAIALSFGISFVGAALLLCGKVPSGVVASVGGLVSSVQSVKFAKYNNERLDKILTESYD